MHAVHPMRSPDITWKQVHSPQLAFAQCADLCGSHAWEGQHTVTAQHVRLWVPRPCKAWEAVSCQYTQALSQEIQFHRTTPLYVTCWQHLCRTKCVLIDVRSKVKGYLGMRQTTRVMSSRKRLKSYQKMLDDCSEQDMREYATGATLSTSMSQDCISLPSQLLSFMM